MTKNILLLIIVGLLNTTEILSQNKILDSIPDRLQWDKTKTNTKELNALLADPLNLQTIKKAKTGRSNSGGGPSDKFLFRPNYDGFYYFYFVFQGFNEHGPRITTYKKGKDIAGYMDTTEVFIQLSCDALDKDLGKANILSIPTKEILKKFGDNYIKKGQTLIYQYNKTILIVSYSSNHTWFKIAKLSRHFDNYDQIDQTKKLISYF